MSSTQTYAQYVIDGIDGATLRPMMGEYLLYYQGKLVGGIYDNRLLVKPTPSAKRLLPNASYQLPYQGAKAMLLIEELDDKPFLTQLLTAVANDL